LRILSVDVKEIESFFFFFPLTPVTEPSHRACLGFMVMRRDWRLQFRAFLLWCRGPGSRMDASAQIASHTRCLGGRDEGFGQNSRKEHRNRYRFGPYLRPFGPYLRTQENSRNRLEQTAPIYFGSSLGAASRPFSC
jgi:hypothetical protein